MTLGFESETQDPSFPSPFSLLPSPIYFRTAATLLLAIIVLCAGCARKNKIEYFPYQNRYHAFRVELPKEYRGHVNSVSRDLNTSIGTVHQTAYQARGRNALFEVLVYEPPDILPAGATVSDYYSAFIDQEAGRSRVLSRGRTKLDGMAAQTLRMRVAPKYYMRQAALELSGRLFVLRISTKKDKWLDRPEADHFFKSFRYIASWRRNAEKNTEENEPATQGANSAGPAVVQVSPEAWLYMNQKYHFTLQMPNTHRNVRHQTQKSAAGPLTDIYSAENNKAALAIKITPNAIVSGDPVTVLNALKQIRRAVERFAKVTAEYDSELDGFRAHGIRYQEKVQGREMFGDIVVFFVGRDQFELHAGASEYKTLYAPEMVNFRVSFHYTGKR